MFRIEEKLCTRLNRKTKSCKRFMLSQLSVVLIVHLFRAHLLDRKTQELTECKIKLAQMTSQHQSIFMKINKQARALMKTNEQLESKVEKLKRSNVAIKSKLEVVKMQRY